MRIKRLILLLSLPFVFSLAICQPGLTEKYLSDDIGEIAPLDGLYSLTVYVVPSVVRYDWSSPHGLHRSFIKNYKRNMFKKVSYLLGHAFIELRSPGDGRDIFTGMRARDRQEQKEMVLKEGYGLSILGTDMAGKLEDPHRLNEKAEHFAKKGQMAFITMLINEPAARRMLKFFETFSSGEDTLTAPRFHYGGAYYPRYHGEGAGCSAFSVAFMDLGGLFRDMYGEWLVSVNIPMDLMGGPYHVDNDVKLKDIRKRHRWADSSENYEHFEIYDPTYMFGWIEKHRGDETIGGLPSRPVQIYKANGILIDARQVPVPVDEPIFIERDKPSVFVK